MHQRSIYEHSLAIGAGNYSSEELTRHYLGRIDSASELNAFITPTPEIAIDQARAADQAIKNGNGGDLTGIPIVHKDLFCTQGVLTSCGSKILSNFVSPYDATVVDRLKDRGMVMAVAKALDLPYTPVAQFLK